MALSKKKIKDYVKGGGGNCPYCDSDNLEGGQRDGGDGYMSQYVYCKSCQKSWDDVYTLTGVYEYEDD